MGNTKPPTRFGSDIFSDIESVRKILLEPPQGFDRTLALLGIASRRNGGWIHETHNSEEIMEVMVHVMQTLVTRGVLFGLDRRRVAARMGRSTCPAAIWKNIQADRIDDA